MLVPGSNARSLGRIVLDLERGRRAYVQVARGGVRVNGQDLAAGDGARIQDEGRVEIAGLGSAEVLVFDLPA